jgi:hypothetical protein
MGSHAADKGAGLRLLSGRITSPTLLDQIAALKARYPDLRRHRFEPADHDDIESARTVYGQALRLRPRLMDVAVVVAFDADPLGPGSKQAANARALTIRRGSALRLFSAECAMTLTGPFADRRIGAHPDAIEAMIAALASRLGASLSAPNLQDHEDRFVATVANALQADRRRACSRGPFAVPPQRVRSLSGSTIGWLRLSTPLLHRLPLAKLERWRSRRRICRWGRFRRFLSSIRIPSQRRRVISTLRL